MSQVDQIQSDQTAEVRWQLVDAAIDDIFSLIRGLRQSGQTVDDNLLAAAKQSAITIGPGSSREEALEFWRNYAALIIAVKPQPAEDPTVPVAVSRPLGLPAASVPTGWRRRLAGWVLPLAGTAIAAVCVVIALSVPRQDGIAVEAGGANIAAALPIAEAPPISAEAYFFPDHPPMVTVAEGPADLRPESEPLVEALIDVRQEELWREGYWAN